jgi:hypothetical protein
VVVWAQRRPAVAAVAAAWVAVAAEAWAAVAAEAWAAAVAAVAVVQAAALALPPAEAEPVVRLVQAPRAAPGLVSDCCRRG